jgi:hypothetical protein
MQSRACRRTELTRRPSTLAALARSLASRINRATSCCVQAGLALGETPMLCMPQGGASWLTNGNWAPLTSTPVPTAEPNSLTLTSDDGASRNDGLGLCPNRSDDHARRDDPTRGHRHVRGRL